MDKITFAIPGAPKAQKRHRHTKQGNFVRVYDPSAQDKKDFLLQAMKYAPRVPYTGVVYVTVWFCLPRPKSHYRTGKFAGILKDSAPLWHISKSDLDNNIKLVFDSLNGVFWKDDSQICSLIAQKRYSSEPRTVIQIDFK